MTSQIARLRARGFDRSEHNPATHISRVSCSHCEALVINGVSTHETGCPNAMRECAGCNNLIPARQFSRFCEDCR